MKKKMPLKQNLAIWDVVNNRPLRATLAPRGFIILGKLEGVDFPGGTWPYSLHGKVGQGRQRGGPSKESSWIPPLGLPAQSYGSWPLISLSEPSSSYGIPVGGDCLCDACPRRYETSSGLPRGKQQTNAYAQLQIPARINVAFVPHCSVVTQVNSG